MIPPLFYIIFCFIIIPIPSYADTIDHIIEKGLKENTRQSRYIKASVDESTTVTMGGLISLSVTEPLYSDPGQSWIINLVPIKTKVHCHFTGKIGGNRSEIKCGQLIFSGGRQAIVTGSVLDAGGAYGLSFDDKRQIHVGARATIILVGLE